MERKASDRDPSPEEKPASKAGEETAAGQSSALAADTREQILPVCADDDDEEIMEWVIRGQPGRLTQTLEHRAFGPSRFRR